MSRIAIPVLVLALGSCTVACGQTTSEPAPAPEPVPAQVPSERPPTELAVGAVDVHRVALAYPRKVPDAEGKLHERTEAFIVRVEIQQPPFASTALHVWLGDTPITEFSGWEKGLYFLVFEADDLQRLDGKEVRYAVGDAATHSSGVTVQVGDVAAIPQTTEEALLPRRKTP
jgi:hypothetical protein